MNSDIIVSLKSSRFSNRFYLQTQNGYFFPVSIDDLYRLKLKSGASFNLDQATMASFNYLLTDYALRQLAMSPKTAVILVNKLKTYQNKILKKYKYPDLTFDNPIKDIVDSFKEKGLLNEKDYVDYFIRRHPRYSRRQLEASLYQKGIKLSDFSQEDYSSSDELDKIKKYLIRKAYKKSDLSDFKFRQKVMATLFRQGFSLDNIRSTIDDYRQNS